jgi:cytosine/creatinine deaminase
MSLTLRNATLSNDPAKTLDVRVSAGKIVEIGNLLTPGEQDIDLAGRLLIPGFVETHIHLDKSCILHRCSSNRGDIEEAISEVARIKGDFTSEDVYQRASRTINKCITHGTTRMRTHVEVDPVIGLTGYNGVKDAIKDADWAIDVEVCVFPQEGLLNNPGTDELMVAALKDGAGCVGAAPYTDTDPRGQIDRVFELAREFDVDIDMHLDFGGDVSALDAEYVCKKTDEFGWGGRVAIGHVTKFSVLPQNRLQLIGKKLADSGVAVTVLPSTDLFLMHREHDHLVPRGVTQVHKLIESGVNCTLSTNNVLNPFTPFGDCSLLRMANLYANIAQIGKMETLAECLNMVSSRAAKLLNLKDYGLSVGMAADMVVIDNTSAGMAVAELSQPMYGFKAGKRTFTHPLPQIHKPN